MAYIKTRFIWLFCLLFVYTILCLTRCWAFDLFDDSSSKGITLRHDMKIPIGATNRKLHHLFLPTGTPIKEIPEKVSERRITLGLPAEILLSEQERFFQEFSWKTRRNQFVKSPMPGVVTKIYVKKGNTVEVGDRLGVMEAMKMENTLCSFLQGTVKNIFCDEGRIINNGSILISLLPHSTKWETVAVDYLSHHWALLASFFPWTTTPPPENSPPDSPKETTSFMQEKDSAHNHESVSQHLAQEQTCKAVNIDVDDFSHSWALLASFFPWTTTPPANSPPDSPKGTFSPLQEKDSTHNDESVSQSFGQNQIALEENLAIAEPVSETKGPVQQHEPVSIPLEQALPSQSIQITRADFTLIHHAHGFHIQPNNKSSSTSASPFQGSTPVLKTPREKQKNLKRSLKFLLKQEEIIVDSYQEPSKSRSASPLFTLDKLAILGLMIFGKLLFMFKIGPLAKISYLTYLFPHATSYNASPLANIRQLNASCFNQYSLLNNKLLSNTNAPPLTRTKVAHLQRR